MAGSSERSFFGRNASVLLDVLRFGAAIAVALSHMPLHYVKAGPIISERSGNSAVCVFFVLSGFVIRYVTVARVGTGELYAIDRVSRIYSVVLPALLITVVFERAAFLISPGAYAQVANPFPWAAVPLELYQNLSFTVGWWGWGSPPLSNGPFWSLPFECAYYALYGLLHYAPRARWVLVPLLLLAVGPSIALLFPIWLLGLVLYDLYARLHNVRNAVAWTTGVLAAYVAALLALRKPLAHMLERTTVAHRSAALTHAVASFAWGRAEFHGETLHWLDRFSVSYLITGTGLTAALLPTLLVLDRYVAPVPEHMARAIRLVADSTFTLYLVHVPLFILVIALAGGPLQGWVGGWLMVLAAVALSIVLAMVFDRFKNAMRAGLRRVSGMPRTRPVVH